MPVLGRARLRIKTRHLFLLPAMELILLIMEWEKTTLSHLQPIIKVGQRLCAALKQLSIQSLALPGNKPGFYPKAVPLCREPRALKYL